MLKADEIRGPSCLTNARDDEPLFVLRANDEIAPSLVRTWALMYERQKCTDQPGGMTEKQRAKCEEAMALAAAMDHWRAAKLRAEGKPDANLEAQLSAYGHRDQLLRGPDDAKPLEARDIIRRLCRLQGSIWEQLGAAESADCFCGEGGFWPQPGTNSPSRYDGTFENGYRNDGRVLGFVEQAVKEKLERMTGHPIESVERVIVDGKVVIGQAIVDGKLVDSSKPQE